MPVIRVELWEGRDVEVKKKLVKKLTEDTCEILKCPEEAVIVVLYDIAKHNWAQAGNLASEKNF